MSSVELLGLREYEGSIGPDPITLSPATSGGGVWTPANLTSLVAWYDFSNSSSITQSGGAISQINDLSGNGNNATQATGALQPTTTGITINSRAAAQFTNAQWLQNTTIAASQPLTIYLVMHGTGSNFLVPYDAKQGGSAVTSYTDNITFAWHIASTTDATTAQTLASNSSNQVVTIFNNTTTEFFYNRTQIGTTYTTGAQALAGLTMGTNRSGSNLAPVIIGELVVQGTTASGTDLSNWNTYVARWGL